MGLVSSMDIQMVEAAEKQAEICKVFGNVNRVLILWALGDREMSVGDIADAIESSLQNTSQHLRLMKDKGIVASRRKGHVIYYHIEGRHLLRGCQIMHCAYHETT
jgi:DNA-binding transcriptional ArsR family regulator